MAVFVCGVCVHVCVCVCGARVCVCVYNAYHSFESVRSLLLVIWWLGKTRFICWANFSQLTA